MQALLVAVSHRLFSALAQAKIVNPQYGTRCSTVLLDSGTGRRYAERSFVIPMPAGKVRSLNLATAVGIVLYEALRQLHKW